MSQGQSHVETVSLGSKELKTMTQGSQQLQATPSAATPLRPGKQMLRQKRDLQSWNRVGASDQLVSEPGGHLWGWNPDLCEGKAEAGLQNASNWI